MAVDKRRHGTLGDVLVDDTLKHRHLWEVMGGSFVHHHDVGATLDALRGLGLDVCDPVARMEAGVLHLDAAH